MNSLAFALVLPLACGNATAEWSPIGGKQKIFAAYADTASIARSAEGVQMLGLYDFLMPDVSADGQPQGSTVVLREYDCAGKRVRLLAYVDYSGRMGAGKVISPPGAKGPARWEPVVEGALDEAFLAVACAGSETPEIRKSDIPKDAPRFSDYPASPHAGPNAAPDVDSDPRSRRYRTQLRAWAKEKANFAGRYILATWGCGTSCTEIAIIDTASGKVFHPAGARSNYILDVDAEVLADLPAGTRRADFGALHYHADSRLLVLFGQLRRIRFVPKPRP
jgi:hypothetical protein